VERSLRRDEYTKNAHPAGTWAEAVVGDLLKKNPPPNIWRGDNAWLFRLSMVLPFGFFDGMIKRMSGLDILQQKVGGK